MRELTFKGYLSRYVCRLSYCETNNVKQLTQEATHRNARLIEPLVLYAIFTDKVNIMLKTARETGLDLLHIHVLENYSKERMLQALQERSKELPEEYLKVYRSYLCKKNFNQTKSRIKELKRKKILKLQEQLCISNYRIYTDLNLNAGNVNSWLKYGYSNKVSYDIADKILLYLEEKLNALD